MVYSLDRDTDFFDFVTGDFQGEKLAPYFVMIYLDYVF